MKLLKRILLPHTYSSDAYIRYLRGKNIDIGEGTFIFSPNHVTIDVERPHMLSIGKYCKITSGVKILTHDYSKSVLLNLDYGDIGEGGFTKIGDNCFLGINSIILMGTEIGDNCIIGAGSVCTGKYPSNSVIAGNPAKVICSLKDFYEKKKNQEISVAKDYVKRFREKFHRNPNIDELTNSFLWIYTQRTEKSLAEHKNLFKHSGIDEKHYIDAFMKSKPVYRNFDEFLKDCE